MSADPIMNSRIVVPAPRPGLDMAAAFGWVQSAAIRAGDYVFVSGVFAVDPESGQRLNGTLTSAGHRALQNLQLVLEAAGSSPARPVQAGGMLYARIDCAAP